MLFGLSTVQVVGIVIGSIVLLVFTFAGMVFVVKHFVPGCKNFRFASPQDTQILVIEGPDDGESDIEEDEEDHEVESA